jgi:hypothetical protein
VKTTPTVPVALVALVITGVGGGLMVIVRVPLPAPPALVALMVTVKVPEAVGVPEINPVEVFTVKPAGNGVAL